MRPALWLQSNERAPRTVNCTGRPLVALWHHQDSDVVPFLRRCTERASDRRPMQTAAVPRFTEATSSTRAWFKDARALGAGAAGGSD